MVSTLYKHQWPHITGILLSFVFVPRMYQHSTHRLQPSANRWARARQSRRCLETGAQTTCWHATVLIHSRRMLVHRLCVQILNLKSITISRFKISGTIWKYSCSLVRNHNFFFGGSGVCNLFFMLEIVRNV